MNLRIALRWGAVAMMLTSIVLSAMAHPLTREQAQVRAQFFLKDKRGAQRLTPVTRGARLAPRHRQPATGTDLYYIFDRGTDEGFVIVSGDDQTPAVLGYTDAGSFDYNLIPDNMREWLDNYALQIAEVQLAGYTAKELPVADLQAHDPIATLVESKWNQGNPYNLLCPDYFRLGTSVTGCVATAMAQVLYYHRANAPKELLENIPDYTIKDSHTTYGDFHVKGYPAGTPIDWDNMQPEYNSSSTAQQKRAVAELMSYCGAAVRMMYSNSSSGAYSSDVPDALRKYFGYPSTCRLINRSDMSEEKFDEIVYAELAKGDPVYLSGSNGSGGHAFVCDGYDGNLCYHINWGWGGGSDGYYLLANLHPGSQGIGGSAGGYSSGQAAIIGMHLEDWSKKAMTFTDSNVRSIAAKKWDADADGKVSYAEAAAVTDFGDDFKGSSIRSFNELYWFTSLKVLPSEAFSGCASMTAIRLPKNLTSIGERAFEGCTALKSIVVPSSLRQVGVAAFADCSKLVSIQLPSGVEEIAPRTFENCASLTSFELPKAVVCIGDRAFAGCTRLTDVNFESLQPQAVKYGAKLFDGVDLSTAQLTVAQGTEQFFNATAPWNTFGNMVTERNLASGKVVAPTEDLIVYLYNVGSQSYLTSGEASDVQGIVGTAPMRFRLGHTDLMPEGTYFLAAEDIRGSAHYFYRLSSNSTVGSGVKATYVNGSGTRIVASDMSGWWNIRQVSPGVYTLQTPADAKGYTEGEFLGTDREHATKYASPTSGVYYDISYEDHPQNCQWMFIAYDETTTATHAAAQVLCNLLDMAAGTDINVSMEQAVYDNMNASLEQLQEAQDRLRKKLGIVTFASDAAHQICLEYWDLDYDGELTAYEISGVPNISTRFQGNKMTSFDEFQNFKGVTLVPSNAFSGCSKMKSIVLPESVIAISDNAFQNCASLQEVELPAYITSIGASAFGRCRALKEVRLHVSDPKYILLDANIFQNVDLSEATLYVPQGTSQLYSEADVWKNFGTIREMRSATRPEFSQFNVNEDGYIYNLGSRMYISRGEAYGTQAVVAQTGMTYQFKRATLSGKTCYYLYSEETGNNNKNLFRSEDDSKVGQGIRTCFVDGGSNRLTDRSAYWNVEYVEGEEPYFTMQVPASLKAAYVEGEYLGTSINHATGAVSGTTQGLYWDVPREGNEANCLWAWVSMADVEAAQHFDDQVAQLKRYLQLAGERGVEAKAEQAVYDNLDATPDEIRDAVDALCQKLHFIRFGSDVAKRICINNWDNDIDGELSYEEAAAVKELGEVFRAHTDIVTLDELQYFTGLTEIPENAFRGCSKLLSIYLPAGVQKIGHNAFTTTRNLRYMVLMNPAKPVETEGLDFYAHATIFVPKVSLTGYRADEFWSNYNLEEYTGQPIVVADTLSRAYGAGNGTLTFSVKGAPVNGTPKLATDINLKTEVGEYPITIEAGDITTQGVQLKDGIYKVVPATLTITANSYKRQQGEENPTFEYTIKGFKNKETEEVLTAKPVAVCEATKDSPAGRYEITFSGAEAANYDFEYVPGWLDVLAPDGVGAAAEGGQKPQQYYDLSGRKLKNVKTQNPKNLRKGILITEGKKLAVK